MITIKEAEEILKKEYHIDNSFFPIISKINMMSILIIHSFPL